MLRMNNYFECTDSDCMQCGKHLEDRKYIFIQAIWMGEKNEYCVVANTEDLTEMSLHDIECSISGYYGSIEKMEEINESPLGQLDSLIAECSFENHPYCDWEYKSKVVTWERAGEIIQKFIDTDGTIFLQE